MPSTSRYDALSWVYETVNAYGHQPGHQNAHGRRNIDRDPHRDPDQHSLVDLHRNGHGHSNYPHH